MVSGITCSTHITTRLSLLTPYSIDPPIHLMATPLPILPRPPTLLGITLQLKNGPNMNRISSLTAGICVAIQCTAYFLGDGNAAAVLNIHGWCGILVLLQLLSINLQTTAMSPLLNSSFSYSTTQYYATLGRRMETSSDLIRIMVMN